MDGDDDKGSHETRKLFLLRPPSFLNSEFPSLLDENGDVLYLFVDQEIDLILSKVFGDNFLHRGEEDH